MVTFLLPFVGKGKLGHVVLIKFIYTKTIAVE